MGHYYSEQEHNYTPHLHKDAVVKPLPAHSPISNNDKYRIHLAAESVRAELKDVIHLKSVWVTITYLDNQGNKRVFYTEKV